MHVLSRSLSTLTNCCAVSKAQASMGRGGAAETSGVGSTVPAKGFQLVGASNFKRSNPMTDRFEVDRFHHVEFWCADATSTWKRFSWGLGMTAVAKSDQSTGNSAFASYALQSSELVFAITAPYSRACRAANLGAGNSAVPVPWFDQDKAFDFVRKHGLAVRAIGLSVADARVAFETSTQNGAVAVQPPTTLRDEASGTEQTVAEVVLYGDVVMRFVSGSFQGPYLAGFSPSDAPRQESYGLQRLDHAVGNVHKLLDSLNYIGGFTGFHEFAEFTAEDVGTLDSGLNSLVLASNNEMVIMPVNEPTFGTPRKSQIQTYLEQNEGPGLQHLALKTDDVLGAVRKMRRVSGCGGFDFMAPASAKYYKNLPAKIGDVLTPEQYKEVEELGILVDKDDQGVLMQIFSKPLSDRPTVFVEIIQRVGCEREVPGMNGAPPRKEQAGGCGGFGKGNFSELFKSIEDYEKTLKI